MINHQSSIVNGSDSVHFESLYPDDVRFKEIEQVLSYIKEGNSVQVISLPGVGGSTIFGFLSYNRNVRLKHLGENQKWFHFVTIPFAEIRKRPLSDVTKFLFLNLVDSLRERKKSPAPLPNFAGEEAYEKAQEIFKESIGFNDELVLFQGLKRVIDLLAIEHQLTIVFLFDRFEEYIPTVTPEFFTNLRVLRNRAKYRFSVVFSLHRPIEDLLEPTVFTDFYEFIAGHTVYLPLMDKPGLDFRISYLEKITDKKLDKKMLEQIIHATSGHGKLTRLSVEAVLASSPDVILNLFQDLKPKGDSDLRQNDNLLQFLLDQKTIQGTLYEIWYSFTPHEQTSLHTVISSINEKSPSETPTDDHQYLENIGLLKEGKITIPLFAAFLAQQKTTPTQKQEITFDEQTNEIKKGDTLLSDKLTSSEYKLLKFFMQNADRVLEREEVIKAVWKEQNTTEGVTDQAVDQLIFRLRKKIEDDPNNPTHLQTVKGRGFRFIP